MTHKPKLTRLTRAQKVALLWNYARRVHKACVEVDQLFTRNCLLFELQGMNAEEMDEVLRAVQPLYAIRDELEMLDLDPEEREAAEEYVRDFMRLSREW